MMLALAILLGFGLAANLGVIFLGLFEVRREALRKRRGRAFARELNSRRWVLAEERKVVGGSRVTSAERWPL
jgi:hypothetical protein